jgi:hypothetical protein
MEKKISDTRGSRPLMMVGERIESRCILVNKESPMA